MRALPCLALLGLLVATVPVAQACSLTGSPTGCATDFYRVEKANVQRKLGAGEAWSEAAVLRASACGDAPAVQLPQGPGSGMFTAYAADMQGQAGQLQSGLTERTSRAIAVFLVDAFGRSAQFVTDAENGGEAMVLTPLPGVVDAAWRDPSAALAGGSAGVQAYALSSQGAAGAAVLCAQHIPVPAL